LVKIYGGALGAFLGDKVHVWLPVTLNATSLEDANKHLLSQAKTLYPEKKGYYNHYSDVVEVTEAQIEEFNFNLKGTPCN
jgi:hypothetical protein